MSDKLKNGKPNWRGCVVKVRYADGWRLAQVITHIRNGRWLVLRLSGIYERAVVHENDWIFKHK